MRYLAIAALMLAAVFALGVSAQPQFSVTIDATALTPQTMGVQSVVNFHSSAVETLSLEEGSYRIIGGPGNNATFDVTLDANGEWDYPSGFDDFLSGRGTTELVVNGFTMSMDATALTSQNMVLDFIKAFSSNDVTSVTVIPGTYSIDGGGGNNMTFSLTIDNDGKWQYAPGFEDFLSGDDTAALVIDGFTVTMDATALTPQNMVLDFIKAFSSGNVTSVTVIPGSYSIDGGGGNNMTFSLTIDDDGKWQYAPGFEDFLSGDNTSTLEIDGFQFFVDARELDDQGLSANYGILFITSWLDTSTVDEFRLIPGLYRLDVRDPFPGSNFLFRIDDDGLAQNLPSTHLGIPVTGAGTNTLLIGNDPPVPVAGSNFSILSQEQSLTTIAGTAIDPEGDSMSYSWYEVTAGGDVLLTGPTPVAGMSAPLSLSTLSPLSIGNHTFRLEVSDQYGCASDTVTVTVNNSPPVSGPTGGGTFECSATTLVTLGGQVADYDGDALTVEWRLDGNAMFPAEVVTTSFGGGPASLAPKTVDTQTLGVGVHTIELVVDDGTNAEVSASIEVEVVDTTPPTLNPVPSVTILWPPNHKMVDVTVAAGASDSCDGSPTISVNVTSSEPVEYDGDGNTIPDHEVVSINQTTGQINLRLRSERSGKGDGRVYTIEVTATDASGNASTAAVTVRAPHNKKG